MRRHVRQVERHTARREIHVEVLDLYDPLLIEDDFGSRCENEACPICHGMGEGAAGFEETALDVYFAMKPLRDQALIAVMGWALP